MQTRRLIRPAAVVAGALALLPALVGPAATHITVQPPEVEQADFATAGFPPRPVLARRTDSELVDAPPDLHRMTRVRQAEAVPDLSAAILDRVAPHADPHDAVLGWRRPAVGLSAT